MKSKKYVKIVSTPQSVKISKEIRAAVISMDWRWKKIIIKY